MTFLLIHFNYEYFQQLGALNFVKQKLEIITTFG